MERRAIDRLVERWLKEAVGAGNLALFDELLGPELGDSEPFKRRAEALHRALRELETSLDELVVEGDRVAWRWTVTGVRSDERRVSLRGANFQRVAHGRVVEHWTLADASALLD